MTHQPSPDPDYDPMRDSLACWELAIACLRVRHETGMRHDPETLARIVTQDYVDQLHRPQKDSTP